MKFVINIKKYRDFFPLILNYIVQSKYKKLRCVYLSKNKLSKIWKKLWKFSQPGSLGTWEFVNPYK